MASNTIRPASMLILMSEAEALLSRSEPLGHAEAARVVELLAKLRDADMRDRSARHIIDHDRPGAGEDQAERPENLREKFSHGKMR